LFFVGLDIRRFGVSIPRQFVNGSSFIIAELKSLLPPSRLEEGRRSGASVEERAVVSFVQMDRLSSIKHPCLVMLMGACPDRGFIIYEYMPRGSLEDRLRCKDGTPPFPWFDRMCIAAEICEGLLFMHSIQPEPIVHHDLKPSNILLDNDLSSKISDFRLVWLVSDRSRLQNLTPESDVYRFGILILQLLVGEPTIEPMSKMQRSCIIVLFSYCR